jgi:hypothetical protein
VSASKRKGTAWESAVVAYVRPWFPWADRVPLSGSRDRGDVTLGPGSPVIEAKNVKQAEWGQALDEANAEARNAGAPFGAVWAKRRGKTNPGDGFVVMDGHSWVGLTLAAGYGPESVEGGAA